MKYYFKIGTADLSDSVSAIRTEYFSRNVRKDKTFVGNYVIDIGAEKRKITVSFGALTASQIATIRNWRKSGTATISIRKDDGIVSFNAYLANLQEPKPVYVYGDVQNGTYYLGCSIMAEEI